MAATSSYKCKCCGVYFTARVADRKRGWARFCSKSCKAIRQTQKNGYSPHNYRGSGVSKETYLHYARENGGIPKFDRHGAYTGFVMSPAGLAGGGYGSSENNDGHSVGYDKW